MKKFLKTLLIVSVLIVSCFFLVACDKKEKDDKNDLKELLGLNDTEEIEPATTEATTTEETPTTEITTTEATTTEAVVEERPDYIVTDEVDTSNIPNIAVEGTDINPAKQGEWVQALKTMGTDEPRQTIYFRTTEVLRGEDALSVIRDYEANDGLFKFDDLGYDDLEYCVVTYQVYFPEDFPEQEWGIGFTSLSFHIVDGDNAGLINNYIGMTQTYDISDYVKNKTLYAGDVLERQVVIVMVKEYKDYMIYYRYYDDDYNEYTKYIACEQLPEGNSQSNETDNVNDLLNNTTETQTNTSTCTIKNDVYYSVGVLYDNGTYLTQEQIEANAGEPFEVVFTVFDGKCIFDATGVGNDGAGRTAGEIVQTSETEFYFTDPSGKTYNGTYNASKNEIIIDMGESSIVFVAD